jgi:hypothetical protein
VSADGFGDKMTTPYSVPDSRSLIITTPLAVDSFQRANENPLNATNWTESTFGSGFTTFQVLNDLCVASVLLGGIELYTGITSPNDQYCSFVVNSMVLSSDIELYLRSNLAISSGYSFDLLRDDAHGAGSATLTLEVLGGATFITTTVPSVNKGDIFTVACIGTTFYVYRNYVELAHATDATHSSGIVGMGLFPVATVTDTTVSQFSTGMAILSGFPNSSRNVQNTLIYDVQTSSNSAVPGTDSRAAGAPVDDRVAAIIPLNSRTPGTYGPGE